MQLKKRRVIIMGSLILKRGMKPSEEQIRRIIENAPKSDDEIDYSDIPATTDEEFKRFFRANPRTPEEWEQFYKYCPKRHQESLAKMRKALGQYASEPPKELKNSAM